jgi:ATP-dependent DNA helicase PIF1
MQTTAAADEHRAFYCPIALTIMNDPVISKTGHTFERSAIEKWLKTNTTCPMTKEPLSMQDLVPNRSLLEEIEQYKQQQAAAPAAEEEKETKKIVRMTPLKQPEIKTVRTTAAAVGLSPEQRAALDKALVGDNLFVSGAGGTGKTFWIASVVRALREQNKNVAICAMTGCAAVLLQSLKARTLHSWSGLNICNGPRDKIIQRMLKSRLSKQNWRTTDVLIVDEVSMMSVKIFEILDEVGKEHRRCFQLPFGGLQVIFVGDFFQLPPVGEPKDPSSSQYCFQSALWDATFQRANHFLFQTAFRQADPVYFKLLNEVRVGVLSPEAEHLLYTRVVDEPSEDKTRIFAVKYKVDSINRHYYNKLDTEEHVFEAVVVKNCTTYETGEIIPPELMALPRTFDEEEQEIARLMQAQDKTLMLKIGAAVMLTYNLCIEDGLCNGSQGRIVGMEKTPVGICPVVHFRNGKTVRISPHYKQSDVWPRLAVGQVPLVLAWALTIHKIQGATLDCAVMDLGTSVFEYGQTYVALSRVKTLEGLYITHFQPSKIRANSLVVEFYNKVGAAAAAAAATSFTFQP